MKRIILFCLFPLLISCTKDWKDEQLPSDERAALLVSKMTLQEKVRQMNLTRGDYLKTDGKLDPQKIHQQVEGLGIGAIHDFYAKTAEEYNTVQRAAIEASRLKIPALVMEEMLHGYYASGATVFPMPIAMGASWSKPLMEQVGHVIGTEARTHGSHMALGPTLGIAREPRWGRVAELYSEDTQLASDIGGAMIKGMHGESFKSPYAMIAGPKHFAVHSAPITGSNASPVLLGERTSRTDFLPVFERAIKQEGALNVMSSYSELDGVPCTGNQWLLTDILRKEWGFKGFVISDLGAMRFLWNVHHYADNPREAIRKAVEAGLDMQFYDFPDSMFQATVIDLVEKGELDEKCVDRAAKGVLTTKFALGLFEHPYVDQALIDKTYHSKAHQEVALNIAKEGIVLLKNDGILPLKKNKYKQIAVLGPNAKEAVLGGYTIGDAKGISILDGLKSASPKTKFVYEKAANIVARGTAIQPQYLFHGNGQPGLKASFFNNMELKGKPVLERVDPKVDFEWPWSPYPGVEDDFFSVRWEGYLQCPSDENGWIGTTCDDGARIYINDELVLDSWAGSSPIKKAAYHFKKGVKYKLRYEYFDRQWHATASLRWSRTDRGIEKAVRLAKASDLSIIVVGENTKTVDENRDVSTLDLSGNQLEMIQAVAKVGKPYIVVLQNGRPLSTNWVSAHANALVEGWFLGEQGGNAMAKILFGEESPSGRLPISVPKSVGQLPIYYNQKPTTIHRYVDQDDQPLYPFGYGLSYANFKYDHLKVKVQEGEHDFQVNISVEVTNTSKVDAKETVQVYAQDLFASVTTARKSLKAFDKQMIKAGETKTFHFILKPHDLRLWNQQHHWTVEKGDFKLMVGHSSVDFLSTKFTINKNYKLD
ncbi:glycoside hydrolase family 3 protein [Persicobacter psychrovividus]|uniref:Beta-glucosidase n=1 Tax=Persicobacter psychrovividus TaxID=387638 RepID=A0ABM7VJL8_9BACT|nr:beta-glucosidase [Persicobacter psychrovividus]